MLKKTLSLFAFLLMLAAAQTPALADNPKVLMKTSQGDVEIELFADKAPNTVKNFLGYVNEGAYDGTIFHRVIKGFMNQGGGFDKDYKKRPTKAPIQNEADNGLKNKRGTIAMARTGQPHSATNQFFINTVDNPFLNHTGKNMRGWGYAVFGEVTKGMEVMDKIADTPTKPGRLGQNMPITPVVIEKIEVIEE